MSGSRWLHHTRRLAHVGRSPRRRSFASWPSWSSSSRPISTPTVASSLRRSVFTVGSFLGSAALATGAVALLYRDRAHPGDHPTDSSSSAASASSSGPSISPVWPLAHAAPAVVSDRGHQHKHGSRTVGQQVVSEGPAATPGEPRSMATKVIDTTADILQRFAPLESIHLHLCGIHTYNGANNRQVVAHHFCSHINDEVHQCLIYDTDKPDARLIGVEYIVSEKLFATLPNEEKKYWHSHAYEVKSALLVAPSLPITAERALMNDLVNTYGKTFHTWQVDRGDILPLGPPQLMMSFTQDGQVYPGLLEARDDALNLTERTAARRLSRQSIEPHAVQPAADHWQTETPWQVRMARLETAVVQDPSSGSVWTGAKACVPRADGSLP